MQTRRNAEKVSSMQLNNLKLSRRGLLQLAAGASAVALAKSVSAARKPALFQNPLFAGDYPDVSVLRVGDEFYITHTSYHYAPGLVIWHSRDLVNWTHLANGLDHTYGEVWAPDLVEYQGHYYIYFALDERLTVIHAPDPRGPWSQPIDLKVNDIDPGHVVGPDGTRSLYSAGGKVAPLSADGLSVIGPQKHVYDGWPIPSNWVTQGLWLEGPKLTRRGEYYYLTSAEGGTDGPPTSHMAVVARSKSPLGPWENSPHNPLIHTYSADETWWSVGHGTLVSTHADSWYIVYHGYRNGLRTLGRQTLMEPIEWTLDGWPRSAAR
jgi:xylan 1,4-beta-xylosidase